MSTKATTPDRNPAPTRHEADIELDNDGPCPLDAITPYQYGSDTTMARPCAYCGLTGCGCDDSPFDHIANRHGW